MKILKMSVVLGLALLATSALAENKASMFIPHGTTINGKALREGKYTVTWEGNGSNVELSVRHGKEIVATAPARLLNLQQPSRTNAVVTQDNHDGSTSLARIDFGGKKYSLEIVGESAQAQTNSAVK